METRPAKRLPRSVGKPPSLVQNFLRARNFTFATASPFLHSLAFRFTRKSKQRHPVQCLYGSCTSVSVPSLSAHMFFCCVGTLFARGVKDAERTTLPASLPKRTLFSIFSHRTHKGHTVPVRFLFLPRKEVYENLHTAMLGAAAWLSF